MDAEERFPQLRQCAEELGGPLDLALVVEVTRGRGIPLRRIAQDISSQAKGVRVAVVAAPLRGGQQVTVLSTDRLRALAEKCSDMKDMARLESAVRKAGR
ncbi:hypothetical protein [Streptomyces uncialis]|nr:hypothetical protein [Streptomyces uncialis]